MTNESSQLFECVGLDTRPQIMIELRFSNGNAIALSYACLVSAELDASGEIILAFTEHQVSIRGQQLLYLFQRLQLHQVPWIAVLHRAMLQQSNCRKLKASGARIATITSERSYPRSVVIEVVKL